MTIDYFIICTHWEYYMILLDTYRRLKAAIGGNAWHYNYIEYFELPLIIFSPSYQQFHGYRPASHSYLKHLGLIRYKVFLHHTPGEARGSISGDIYACAISDTRMLPHAILSHAYWDWDVIWRRDTYSRPWFGFWCLFCCTSFTQTSLFSQIIYDRVGRIARKAAICAVMLMMMWIERMLGAFYTKSAMTMAKPRDANRLFRLHFCALNIEMAGRSFRLRCLSRFATPQCLRLESFTVILFFLTHHYRVDGLLRYYHRCLAWKFPLSFHFVLYQWAINNANTALLRLLVYLMITVRLFIDIDIDWSVMTIVITAAKCSISFELQELSWCWWLVEDLFWSYLLWRHNLPFMQLREASVMGAYISLSFVG